jgi:8-oxo-dGTP diphosphatase / 2-hydroxy-dATP diphosphatase
MKKLLTLGLIVKDNKILLGMKKRGFGEGRWNGFGGKLEEGESIEEAMKREMFEECQIKIEELKKIGVINFIFTKESKEMQVHIYIIKKFVGTPIETEEMKPQWFELNKIPYEQMWPDDKIWIPLFLKEKYFSGEVYFLDINTIIKHTIREVNKLE